MLFFNNKSNMADNQLQNSVNILQERIKDLTEFLSKLRRNIELLDKEIADFDDDYMDELPAIPVTIDEELPPLPELPIIANELPLEPLHIEDELSKEFSLSRK